MTNGQRADADGTFTEETRSIIAAIGVIVEFVCDDDYDAALPEVVHLSP